MPFFDTHTHLDFVLEATGETLSDCLTASAAEKIAKIAVMGIFAEQFPRVLALKRERPKTLVAALGLHPLFTARHRPRDLERLEKLLPEEDVLAIGEIGLDRYVADLTTPANWQKQCAYFTAQLELARKRGLPVLIHARRAHAPVYDFLKKTGSEGVIHAFSGSFEEAKRYLELGFKLGVGGVITYPRATKTRGAIQKIPAEALVLETDAPDMPISGEQGRPNHPQNLTKIFAALCLLRGDNPETLAAQLWRNSCELFHLPASIPRP